MTERRILNWAEIKKHSEVSDRWIVIENKVYDVTKWQNKHPGGRKIIGHFATQDATEAFRAFHSDLNGVKKYLKAYHVGDVDENDVDKRIDINSVGLNHPDDPNGVVMNQAVVDDFEKVRLKMIDLGLFNGSKPFFAGMLLQIIVFDILGCLILRYFGTSWLCVGLSIAASTIAQAQASWLQHDLGHLSVFKSTRWNHFFHELTLGLLKGASCHWWNYMHSQHHAKPNIIDKDPDIRLEPLFVLGEEQPRRAASDKTPFRKHMPYQYQDKYFFLIFPPFLFPLYFQFMSFRHIFLRRRYEDLLWVTGFFLKLLIFYAPVFGFWKSWAYLFVVRICESHWFAWVSQSNHIPMEIGYDRAEAWLPMQSRATCNVEHSVFNDWFTGHLNFQLEHHLFPTMPRHNYIKAQPYVKELCAKHGLPYPVKPLTSAFRDVVRSLKSGADLWKKLGKLSKDN